MGTLLLTSGESGEEEARLRRFDGSVGSDANRFVPDPVRSIGPVDSRAAALIPGQEFPCAALAVSQLVGGSGLTCAARVASAGLRRAHDFTRMKALFGSPNDIQMGSYSTNASVTANAIRAIAQPMTAQLTRAAIFLVVTVKQSSSHRATIRSFCGGLASIVRAVGSRDIEGGLSCVVGFGSDAWNKLFGLARPKELHVFREIRAGTRHAVSTPGDLLFHIRAQRMDLCFELATQIMAALGDAVEPADEVHGFQYFDDRDLIGFVDGTENPSGAAACDAVVVGEEDSAFAGGSYVIVQKYLHDLVGWNALSTEAQEGIIGYRKLSNIELDDSVKPSSAHNALTKIVEDGKEIKILRDSMAFGRAGNGEFGTYFIGYSRSPRTTEQMLENMFIGQPPGNYDRLLDFSRAVTGCLFFAPPAGFLEAAGEDQLMAAVPVPESARQIDGSLGIGSLKGEIPHE